VAYEREYWITVLERIARPVLEHLAAGTLLENLPAAGPRTKYASLEATARVLVGIAPWLELATDGPEEKLRREFAHLARESLRMGLNSTCPDRFNFHDGDQPLVDAGFLAHAVLRAPNELLEKLEPLLQTKLVEGFISSRQIRPYFCNWLLFSAMVEAALFKITGQYDPVRVDYAVRQHEQWYLGDGTYGDGPELHWDYYNSFVIQPMLLDVIEVFADESTECKAMHEKAVRRAQRYAVIQERLIAPDGSFPPLGRSLTYRFGAFQLLAQMALRDELPSPLTPAQVRTALTAVIRRTMDAPGTFDDQGWLTIGLCGHQPQIGEPYITTASTYLCTAGLLPLGLPRTHEFWSAPPEPFTSQKVWSGHQDVTADKAL
jgi:hypothetical protein